MSQSIKKYRILTAEFQHETNTFSKIPTSLKKFEEQCYLTDSNEILNNRLNTKTATGALLEAKDKYNWDIIPTICATANPTGKITDDAFEHIISYIIAPIHESLSSNNLIDGIMLNLHGAMVTESYQDAEGELLYRIRKLVGYNIPIVVTLDLHGNISQLMADNCTSMIAVRTYPHIDLYEVAWKMIDLLNLTLNDALKPKSLFHKPNLLRGLDGGKTYPGSPLQNLVDKSIKWENSNEVLIVSICAGFSAADVHCIGPSVSITYDERKHDVNKINEILKEIIDDIYHTKNVVSANHLTIPNAVEKSISYNLSTSLSKTSAPLVFADATDNPGSGHYGDTTNVLKQLLIQGVNNCLFYAMYDPDAVRQCLNIGINNSGTIILGGNYDPNFGGGPLKVFGEVVTISKGKFQCWGNILNGIKINLGLSILFKAKYIIDNEVVNNTNASVDVAIISNNAQLLDINQLYSLGINPTNYLSIYVKSNHHFRDCLGKVAKEIYTVNGGGLGNVILSNSNDIYFNVRRPIWPLDQIDS